MTTLRTFTPKVITETRKLEPVRALPGNADLLAMRKPVQRETRASFVIHVPLRRTGTR